MLEQRASTAFKITCVCLQWHSLVRVFPRRVEMTSRRISGVAERVFGKFVGRCGVNAVYLDIIAPCQRFSANRNAFESLVRYVLSEFVTVCSLRWTLGTVVTSESVTSLPCRRHAPPRWLRSLTVVVDGRRCLLSSIARRFRYDGHSTVATFAQL